MTFLSQIMPGMRDLRAPIAVGCVWLLALWMQIPRLPQSVLELDPIRHASQLFATLPDGAPAAVMIFGAYLVGVVAIPLGRIVTTVGAMLVMGAGVGLLILAMTRFTIPALISVLVFPSLGSLLLTAYRVRRYSTSLGREYALIGRNFLDRMSTSVYSTVLGFYRFRFTDRKARNDFLVSHVDFLLREEDGLLDEFCSTLAIGELKACARDLGIVESLSAAKRVRINPSLAEEMRNALRHRLLASRHDRLQVIHTSIKMNDMERLAEEHMETVKASLMANHPNVFQDYDRIDSEGEFRMALSLPVGILILSFVSWFSGEELNTLFNSGVLLGVLAAALIYNEGVKRREAAARLLFSSVLSNLSGFDGTVLRNRRLITWSTEGNPDALAQMTDPHRSSPGSRRLWMRTLTGTIGRQASDGNGH